MEKHFCIQCKHHFYEYMTNQDSAWNNKCDIDPAHRQDYVTGRVEVTYQRCCDLNFDGGCVYFEVGDSSRCMKP